VDKELKLEDFKVLYRSLRRGIPWIDHLLLGFLVWLEGLVIEARVKETVDEAIEEYETLHSPPEVRLPEPVYTEVDSPTSELLPEMRLQAPWRRD
jgi:hypothetical protein